MRNYVERYYNVLVAMIVCMLSVLEKCWLVINVWIPMPFLTLNMASGN